MADKRKTLSTSSSDRSFHHDGQDHSMRPTKKVVKKVKTGLNSCQPTLASFKFDNSHLKKFGEDMMKAISNLESKASCIDQKLSGMVTTETLNDKFSKMATKSDLAKATSEIVNKLNTKIENLESRVFDLENTNDDLTKKVQFLETKLSKLEDTVTEVGYTAEKADHDINNLEQYTRKSSIRIFGLNDDKDEKVEMTCQKVQELLQSKLQMNFQNSDIDIAHRLGRYDNKRNRPVIVKFMCRRKKMECIANRHKLSGSHIFIRDDLTKDNQYLMDICKYDDRIQKTWTDNGKIFAQLATDSSIHRIHPGICIDNLMK